MAKYPKKVIEAILLVNDSFVSHLPHSVKPQFKNKCCNRAVGSKGFHKVCLKEYLVVMSAFVDEL